MVFTLVFSIVVSIPSYADSGVIEGNYYSKADAYDWGYYREYKKPITIVIPKDEEQFWVSFKLPRDKHIYTSCTYHDKYEGMTFNVEGLGADEDIKHSPDDVINAGTYRAMMAANIDNNGHSDRTYYIRVTRPESYTGGKMVVSLSLDERIKTGRGTFDFRGTARNRGNSYHNFSNSGVDSSVISVDLRNNNSIPDGAIVTSIETSSRMSPSQGGVHHMLRPSDTTNSWFTSRVSSADSGMYHIDSSDDFEVKQEWEFKYNAMATRSSSMSRVKLEISWEYDISNTGYRAVFN